MVFTGRLKKMAFENVGDEFSIKPNYKIELANSSINFNALLGHKIEIKFLGRITCSACGKTTRKSYGQGYCYPCFISVPETEECVLRPELCRAHEGIARDIEYAKTHCLINHYVYLAQSGGLKVGVTRYHQIPTRWVDQGANRAIIVAETANRFTAGQLEVALKESFADKTNWRNMLMGISDNVNLIEKKQLALEIVNNKGYNFTVPTNSEYSITYPVELYPKKVTSINLDKTNEIEGVLAGIKGQYLLFSDGRVLNIRTHTGYEVAIKSTI
jgi:hypothetical protein